MTAPVRKERRAWEEFCRRAVHDAVIDILVHDGVQGITMEKVAAAAGVAKGTIYIYYRNKDELLQTVKQECLNPMREELRGILAGSGSPRARLSRMVSRHLGYFDEHRDLFRVLLWDRQHAGRRSARGESAGFGTLLDSVAAVLEEGTRAGAFRPLSPRKVAAMIIEADIAIISRRLREESSVAVEEDAQMVLEVFLNGIDTRRRSIGRRS